MSDRFFRRTWAQVDLDALINNYKVLREAVPKSAGIMGIVKADAYGHGVEMVSKTLSELGVSMFGVSSISEAEQLRDFGITEPILILGYTPCELAGELASNDITQTVYSLSFAKALSKGAVKQGVKIKCHIKLDVGMGRLGFLAKNDGCIDEIAETAALEGLEITGIFTHFPSADFDGDRSGDITRAQARLFVDRCTALEKRGIHFETKHCCNSAGSLTVGRDFAALDCVREGITLYGLCPSAALKNAAALKPVMSLKTVVSMVKTVEKGDTVSYGMTFTAQKTMRLATVCIGYADGYPRRLSSKGYMLIKGKKAPIVGRVCMDQLMLDVSDIDDVKVGDEVTVFGKSGNAELSVDEVAAAADTINYELVCILGKRVPRVFIRDGKVLTVTDYICNR